MAWKPVPTPTLKGEMAEIFLKKVKSEKVITTSESKRLQALVNKTLENAKNF
jgi:hypothetical protein